jgi:hypothetical protein
MKKLQGARCKIKKEGYKVRDARCKIRIKIQDIKKVAWCKV